MTLRYTEAQAQSLGLLPTPPVRRGRKTHTADGHAIDPAFVGLRERGRDGFQAEVMKLARRGGWTCGQDDEADLGGLTYHALRGMGATERGWPDLTLIRRRDRRLIFAEIKAEKGELRPRQAAVLDLLRCLEDRNPQHITGRVQLGIPVVMVFVWRPSDMPAIVKVLR
jgi:hypothetical protein